MVAEKRNFDKKLNTRKVFDASNARLDARLRTLFLRDGFHFQMRRDS